MPTRLGHVESFSCEPDVEHSFTDLRWRKGDVHLRFNFLKKLCCLRQWKSGKETFYVSGSCAAVPSQFLTIRGSLLWEKAILRYVTHNSSERMSLCTKRLGCHRRHTTECLLEAGRWRSWSAPNAKKRQGPPKTTALQFHTRAMQWNCLWHVHGVVWQYQHGSESIKFCFAYGG